MATDQYAQCPYCKLVYDPINDAWADSALYKEMGIIASHKTCQNKTCQLEFILAWDMDEEMFNDVFGNK